MNESTEKLCTAIASAKRTDQAACEGWKRIHEEICRLLDSCGGVATTSPDDGACRRYVRDPGELYSTGAVAEGRRCNEHIGDKILELEEQGRQLNRAVDASHERVRLELSELLGPSLAFHLLK